MATVGVKGIKKEKKDINIDGYSVQVCEQMPLPPLRFDRSNCWGYSLYRTSTCEALQRPILPDNNSLRSTVLIHV